MHNTDCPAWVTAMDAPGAYAEKLSDYAEVACKVSYVSTVLPNSLTHSIVVCAPALQLVSDVKATFVMLIVVVLALQTVSGEFPARALQN